MTDPTIRRAVAADVPAIVRIRDDAARWLTGRGIRQWQPGVVGDDEVLGWLSNGRIYVAELPAPTPGQRQASPEAGVVLTRAVVGAVRLAWTDEPVWGEREPEAAYVQALMTARAVAGQGLGRRLLGHVEQVTAASGRPLTRLSCLRGNLGLEAFYRAAGYREVGARSFEGRPGWDPVTLFEKRLS